ncbi:Uncharacterised protein [Mycobacterium tuberculosis]|uniref:Uncharacterized protein n=1 Tax=Mycobacterium tuberculosis TaxID=1773 RepID=A0A654U7Z9_MYCTX|nr:Uncharacterised protein [Mycobacterium tuberculosis]CKR79583.1 Uncharacterised protein [Mycobacterium tuberculosis]CNV64035.1 Uncharacterised protein [Mycobacterium tuberculosis]CNW27282.1 Uncharacterised protein [Mycobacterium tuberculosis]COW71186.1 Uncharacterised protein [Mycobacterium tuberculosis]
MHGADAADRGLNQRRRAAVGHQPHVGVSEHEKRIVGGQYEVTSERQGDATADGWSLHDGNDRLW